MNKNAEFKETTEKIAVLLLGHGSRAVDANTAQYQVAGDLRQTYPIVECAFLELNSPSIPEGLTLCQQAGASRIIVIPYFLSLGRHVQKDLPEIIGEWRKTNPDVEVKLGNPLGYSSKMTALVLERIGEQL